MGSILSIYAYCKSKSNFTSEEQWRKRKKHLNFKKGSTEIIWSVLLDILTRSQWCALLTDMWHCLHLQCPVLLSLEIQVHLPHSVQNERGHNRTTLSQLANLCFLSISYPLTAVWEIHFLKSTLQENLTYFTTTQNLLGPTASLSYILSPLSSLRITVVGCTFIYMVLFILK